MESEGYDVDVIGTPSSDMYCIICLKLMRDAIQMECGHGMCQYCFHKLSNFAKVRSVPLLCPSCRAKTKEDKAISVPMIDRIILSLNVKCSNNKQGCDWVGELGDLKMHLITNCGFHNEEKSEAEASVIDAKIASIIHKNESKGADICSTQDKFYIVRPDIGVYLRSSNFHQGLNLDTYSLHKNCHGDHYLSTSGKFYIIQGDKYHRVSNMNQDKNSVTYSLHANCKGGDVYFCNDFGLFGIIFFDRNICHLTRNMANDEEGMDIKLPEELKDGVYHWGGLYSKHYCLKQSGWQVEYHKYDSFGEQKNASYELNSTVASFLPGGLGVTKGPSQGVWNCIYSEKNLLGSMVSVTKVIKRKQGFKASNTRLPSYSDDLKAKLVLAQFQHDLYDNEKLLLYLREEQWTEIQDVDETLHVKLGSKEEMYVWQYVIEFKHCAGVFFTKFLAFTDTEQEPDEDIESMMS